MTGIQADKPEEARDQGPGVIVRPPLLYLGALILALLTHGLLMPEQYASFELSGGARFGIGMAFLVAGITLMASAMRHFNTAGTSIRTSEATQTLVTSGIYRLSRNPIYLGLTANYLGICVLTDAPVGLVFLVPVLLIMHFGVIAREERYLEGKFGEAYLDFKRRTGRWLGPV